MNRLTIASATLAILLAACATEAPGDARSPTASPTLSPIDSPAASPTAGENMGEMDQQMIDEVVQQAADDTGITADEISVVSAEAVTWSDGSIGCPEEGMAYTQALVPGFRVVLDVAGEEIHYHAGSDGQFFACDDPQPPLDGGTTDR